MELKRYIRVWKINLIGNMSVSKVSKGAEPVSETYVADLYGDVEYMCGSSVVKVRNTLVRQGADRGSAMRPDIYNGVVSWVNPDGSPASFVSSGGGAAVITVRSCVIRIAGYAARPWDRIKDYTGRRGIVEAEDAPALDAERNAIRALDEMRDVELPRGGEAPPSGAVDAAERAAAAVIDWKDANAGSYERWSRLSADFPGVCSVMEKPADWSHITDGLEIECEGENTDPKEQAWTPGEEPDFIAEIRSRIKRVSDLAGRDIMMEAEAARYGFGGNGPEKNKLNRTGIGQ